MTFWAYQTDLNLLYKSEEYIVSGYQGNYTDRNASISVNVAYLLDCSLVIITP